MHLDKIFVAIALMLAMNTLANEVPEKYLGVWSGVWRSEASSGDLEFVIRSNGSGFIEFFNSAEIKTGAIELDSLIFLGNRINFSLIVSEGVVLEGRLFLIGGNRLKGSGMMDSLSLTYRLSRE